MSFMKVGRVVPVSLLRTSLLLASAIALGACGFHLRENVKLPASIQKVHIDMPAGSDFQRMLARALTVAGADVEKEGGPGIAEVRVPVANFGTDTLTAGGYVRITEYAVNYQVQFSVLDADGNLLIPNQRIDMQREYSYDASNTIGNASEVAEIQRSLNEDMVQAILFRLQAASKHQMAAASAKSAPAAATSTH